MKSWHITKFLNYPTCVIICLHEKKNVKEKLLSRKQYKKKLDKENHSSKNTTRWHKTNTHDQKQHHNQTDIPCNTKPAGNFENQTKNLNLGQVPKITKLYKQFYNNLFVNSEWGIPNRIGNFHTNIKQTAKIMFFQDAAFSACFENRRFSNENSSENYLKRWKFWKILHLVFRSRRGKFSIQIERIRFYIFFIIFKNISCDFHSNSSKL